MLQAALQKVPVIRILIPIIIGIISASHCLSGSFAVPLSLFVAAAVGYLAVFLLARCSVEASVRMRAFYCFPIFVMALSLGMAAQILSRPDVIPLSAVNGRNLLCRVNQVRFRDSSQEMLVTLLRCSGDVPVAGTKALLTTRGHNYGVRAGTVIGIRADLRLIRGTGNPYDFDYARYMRNEGIIYSQHLAASFVRICDVSDTPLTEIENLRASLRHKILNSSLSPVTQSFVIALVMGDRFFLGRDTVNVFSASGLAHLLALSGLHIGIISFLLWFLLLPLEYIRLRWLRYLLTFGVLIAFDVFTGMSPSVVRATILLGFVFLSFALRRRYAPFNALLSAALLILVLSPSALFTAGFQLSFVTVASILVFSPRIQFKSRALNYLLTLFATSLIAMASTLMLTAYYFHTVPLLSFLSNVLVIPLFPVILLSSVLYVIIIALGIDWGLMASALDWMYKILAQFSGLVGAAPASHISGVSVSLAVLLLYYLMLVLLAVWIKLRSRAAFAAIALCFLVMICSWCHHNLSAPSHGVMVLNSYNSTPVFYFRNGIGYLWVTDNDELTAEEFAGRHMGLLSRLRIDSVEVVRGDSLFVINRGAEFVSGNYAYLGGIRFLSVGNKSELKNLGPKTGVDVDVALINKRYHGSIQSLLSQFHVAEFVLSGDIYDDDLKRLMAQCDSLAVDFYPIAQRGAFVKY